MEDFFRRYWVQVLVFTAFYVASTQLPKLLAMTGWPLENWADFRKFLFDAPLPLKLPLIISTQVLVGLFMWHFILFWKEARGVVSVFLFAVALGAWPYSTYALRGDVETSLTRANIKNNYGDALAELSRQLYKLDRFAVYRPGDSFYLARKMYAVQGSKEDENMYKKNLRTLSFQRNVPIPGYHTFVIVTANWKWEEDRYGVGKFVPIDSVAETVISEEVKYETPWGNFDAGDETLGQHLQKFGPTHVWVNPITKTAQEIQTSFIDTTTAMPTPEGLRFVAERLPLRSRATLDSLAKVLPYTIAEYHKQFKELNIKLSQEAASGNSAITLVELNHKGEPYTMGRGTHTWLYNRWYKLEPIPISSTVAD